jgi:ABC-2 type transport system permease protein
MKPPSNGVHGFPVGSRAAAPAVTSPPRPLYWSVRREIWENRSVYVAPLAVATVVVVGTLIGMIGLPAQMRDLPTLDPAQQHAVLVRPFDMAPAPIMLATFIVGVFYSLDALYGERRDRSILFWKSLPVSDWTTVLAKASIPLVVLPLIGLVVSVAVQIALLLLGSAVVLGSGLDPAPLWAEFGFFRGLVIMSYGLAVHALWFAPIYGWALLVSAWARRAPLLWAVLPLLAVSAVERMAFDTWTFASLLRYRVVGAMTEAFVGFGSEGDIERFSQLDPVGFLTTPGLWLGLVFAAACLAATVRLRRYREPI